MFNNHTDISIKSVHILQAYFQESFMKNIISYPASRKELIFPEIPTGDARF